MGRLFDAVGALTGVRAEVTFEGQAAIELEAACDPDERGTYPVSLMQTGDQLLIDPRPMVRAVADDASAGAAPSAIATRFHRAIADVTVNACARLADTHGTEVVALSGGVFQNRRLLESVSAGLGARGLQVLVPEQLPVNDGGVAYGQAVIASSLLAAA